MNRTSIRWGNFIARLRFCWQFLWAPERLMIKDFNTFLSHMPEQPLAKCIHQTRKHRLIQFAVKMPRTKTRGQWA